MLVRARLFQCITVGLGSTSLGYDVALIAGLLSNQRWFKDFHHPSDAILGLMIASFVFGIVLGSVPSAALGDAIGRRWTMFLACLVNAIAIIVQTCSVNTAMFIASRFIGGVATSTIVVFSCTFLNEIIIRDRAQLTALAPTLFYLGSIPAAWTAFGALSIESSWSWRLVLLLQLPFALLQMSLILFCPESPRWLFTKGRVEEAKEVLHEITDDPQLEKEIMQLIQETKSKDSWTTFLTKQFRRRLLIIVLLGIGTQWVGNGIISYYLPPFLTTIGIVSDRQQAGINGGLQVFNLIVSVIAACQTDRIGRRSLLLLSAAGMLGSMIAFTVCTAIYGSTGHSAAAITAVITIFTFFGFYDIGFTPVPPMYVSELVPTELRAKTAALMSTLSGCAIVLNQWVNPIALDVLGWRYSFVFIAVLIFMIISLYLIAPETKGLYLEQAVNVCEDGTTPNSRNVCAA